MKVMWMWVQITYGFEGGERLAMMVVNPSTRKKLMIQWITSVYPEELIEDELEEFIATNHKIPEYNTPIDPTKGLYVIVDCHVCHATKLYMEPLSLTMTTQQLYRLLFRFRFHRIPMTSWFPALSGRRKERETLSRKVAATDVRNATRE